MKPKDIDIRKKIEEANKKIEDFRSSTKGIQEIVEFYDDQIAEYQNFLSQAETSVAAAEEQTRQAEEKAEKANQRYKKAIELQEGQYDQLIHDLFEVPRNELERSIKEQTLRSRRELESSIKEQTLESRKELERSIKEQSRRSNVITVSIAAISIIIGILVSVISTVYPSAGYSTALETIKDRTKGIENRTKGIENRTEGLVELVSRNDPTIKQIADRVVKSKKDCVDYQMKTDLSICFKIRLSDSNFNIKYSDYIGALKVAGVQRQNIPGDNEEVRRWDVEYIALCKNAVNVLSQKKGDERVQDEEEKYFRKYKSQEDTTDYKYWRWLGDMTYAQLLKRFQDELNTHEKQLQSNTQP